MLEPNIYGLWVGKQTAKGTPNATTTQRLVQAGGDLNVGRDDGVEEWSDLTKFGAATDYVNAVTGGGAPLIEATPTELAYLSWLFHGGETVTAVTGPPAASKHSTKPQAGRGFYSTWVRRVGQTVVQRQQFNDCIIGQLQLEGSTGQKVMRVTPTVISLDPGVVGGATDPTPALPTDKSLLFTDAAGAFVIDGITIGGHSAFTFVANEDLSVVYGDDTVPVDVVQGNSGATIAVTLYLDANGLARWNTYVYGAAAPTAGTKPLRRVPALGSYAFNAQQRDSAGALNGRAAALTVPGVKWAIPDAPGPAPAGGAVEITLNGQIRPLTPGADPYTLDVYTASTVAAFTT